MKRWKRNFYVALAVITVLFVLQGRIRDVFSPVAPPQLDDSLYVEQTLEEQTELQATVIVPCGWYTGNGALPPMIAGICDGAYQSSVAIKDIACFIAQYNANLQYQVEINSQLAVLWENKATVLSITGNELHQFGDKLSGAHGSAKAEYAYGKVLFETVTMVAGVGELTELSNVVKNTKVLKALKTLPFLRLANLKKVCPPCAELFRAAKSLRNDLLFTNLATTRTLLEADFVKSGKTWEVFIKDYEAHHIIPREMLEASDGLQFYYNNGGKINFNSFENGMMIKKLSKKGFHANHPNYSKFIENRIASKFEIIEFSNTSLKGKIRLMDIELKKIIEETRELIIEKSVNGSVKINSLFQ